MKTNITLIHRPLHFVFIFLFFGLLSACTTPHKVDVRMPEVAPQVKATSFDKVLLDLGLMSEIYADQPLHMMVKNVADNTGSSFASQAEIPQDITEMLKSTLNSVGGKVVYIPYDPEFILNSANTGYSGFDNKIAPNVVVSGGITEFDRGLETRGKNTDLGVEGTVSGKEFGLDFSDQDKSSLARITLDFNLIDFKTLTGISQMQSINTIEVHKALAENSIAFSILGNTIGLKGTVKKVQGRHAAVRLLVQLSMIQVIGKYMNLPYWRLIPEQQSDPVVINRLLLSFTMLNRSAKARLIQKYLILNGYDVAITGRIDKATQVALSNYTGTSAQDAKPKIDGKLYVALYSSVPITHETIYKRKLLAQAENQDLNGSSAISNDGRLQLTTNSSQFGVGDEVKINFSVQSPLYVKVLMSSEGKVWSLFPENKEDEGLLLPGQDYQIPPSAATYALKITGPAGIDKIIAVASPEPIESNLNIIDENGNFTEESLAKLQTRLGLDILIK